MLESDPGEQKLAGSVLGWTAFVSALPLPCVPRKETNTEPQVREALFVPRPFSFHLTFAYSLFPAVFLATWAARAPFRRTINSFFATDLASHLGSIQCLTAR